MTYNSIPGEFQIAFGATNCTQCVANTFSENKHRVLPCNNCPTGRSSIAGSTKCSACAPGKRIACSPVARAEQSDEACPPGSDEICVDCPVGLFSSDINQWRCARCPDKGTTTTKNGSSSCDQCGLGRYGSAPGKCTACTAGRFQDMPGQHKCKLCEPDHFGLEAGATSRGDCRKCNAEYYPHTTTGGRRGISNPTAGCVCAGATTSTRRNENPDGYYTVNRTSAEGDQLCAVCPAGADCLQDGMWVDVVMAKPGYWRPPLHNPQNKFPPCVQGYKSPNGQKLADARCCPGDTCRNLTAAKLKADPDAQCLTGYSGVLCLSCVQGYVKVGADCTPCPGGEPDIGLAFACVGGACVLVFVFVLVFLICGRKAEANAKKVSSLFGQVKILISFLQITSSMPTVMSGVPFPGPYMAFTLPFTAINLNVIGLMSFSACRLALGFLAQTIVHLSVLPLLVLAVTCAYAVANCVRKPKDVRQRTHRRAEIAKMLILGTLLLCKLVLHGLQ